MSRSCRQPRTETTRSLQRIYKHERGNTCYQVSVMQSAVLRITPFSKPALDRKDCTRKHRSMIRSKRLTTAQQLEDRSVSKSTVTTTTTTTTLTVVTRANLPEIVPSSQLMTLDFDYLSTSPRLLPKDWLAFGWCRSLTDRKKKQMNTVASTKLLNYRRLLLLLLLCRFSEDIMGYNVFSCYVENE